MEFVKVKNLLKEPILQFALLGALLFGLDHVLLLNRDDPRNVLIDDRQISEFIEIFEDGQGRPPSGREINNMVIVWAQNEILYREARSMGLDRGDDMIRERLILKLRNVLFNNVVLDYPSEEELEQFFELNKAAYSIPARYDLEMWVLPGDIELVAARQLQERASNESLVDSLPGNLIRYQNRDEANLITLFGVQDSARLLAVPLAMNEWTLISNEQGYHLARITARYDAVVPSLESLRSRVMQDWERYASAIQLANQTYDMASQYEVRMDLSDEYLEKMENDLPRNLFEEAPALSAKPISESGIPAETVSER